MRVHVDLCCATLIVGRERRYSGVSFLNICDYINMSSYFVLCSAFFAQSTHLKVPSQVRAVSMLRLTFQIGIFSCSHQIRNGLRGLLSSGIEHDATNRNPICQHEEQFECLLLYTPHLGTKKLIFCLSDSRPACDSLTIRGLQLPFPSMPIVYHIALIFDDWEGSLY